MLFDQVRQRTPSRNQKVFDKFSVLLYDLRLPALGQNFASKDHQYMPSEYLPKSYDDLIFRSEANLVLEGEVSLVDASPIASPHGIFHQGDWSFQTLQPLGFRSKIREGVASRDRFERCARLAQLINMRIIKINDANTAILRP